MKEVVISTSSLNHYGTRILTEGIELDQYKKNPILLWMHQRPLEQGAPLPLGRIDNLRIEGDRLIGTPIFDMEDEFARKIAQKWEKGFLKMVSGGFTILEMSDKPELLVQGQTRMTITKARLEEVSIVDIGANDDALQLMDQEGRLIKLTKENNKELPLIKNTQETMKTELLQLLGLKEDASDQELLSEIRLLKEKSNKAEKEQQAAITAMVEGAIREKRIDAAKKEHFLELGFKMGLDTLSVTLSAIPSSSKITEVIRNTSPKGAMTYTKLSEVPEEELLLMRENDKDEYTRLYKAEYGFSPKLD